MSGRAPDRVDVAGFTLVEAIVALTLTTVIVALVSSVFLAQSRFYGDVLRRSGAHDAARGVTEVVGQDVRATYPSGIVLADSLRFAARIPVMVGVVCEVQGSRLRFFYPATGSAPDTADATGYGVRDETGVWGFFDTPWQDIYETSGVTAKDACAAMGMDTVGVPTSHFIELHGPGDVTSPSPEVGDVFSVIRSVELAFAESALDAGTEALYRGTYGGDLVEYASGLGDGSHFRYRLAGDDAFETSVSSGDLGRINAVRVVVEGRSVEGGASEPYEFDLTQDVPLRNVR